MDSGASNTGGSRPNKGQFKKGDPRINRKGRPKTFDALRRLAQQIACEIVESEDGSTAMSRIQTVLHDWVTSGDKDKQRAFIEYAYGKVPNPVEMSGKDGKPIQTEDVSLTDDERAKRIAAILDAARARRDGQANSAASESGGMEAESRGTGNGVQQPS